jgi:hypothetical protein
MVEKKGLKTDGRVAMKTIVPKNNPHNITPTFLPDGIPEEQMGELWRMNETISACWPLC